MQQDDNSVVCAAGCKRVLTFDKETGNPELPGWSMLQITGRYRCPQCERELLAAREYPGKPGMYQPDNLAGADTGALKPKSFDHIHPVVKA